MSSEKLLFVAGVVLLAVSALLGFVQYRNRGRPEAFALWRVVHAGGTTGAVQLLALAAVWERFAPNRALAGLALGIVAATFAFFLGPLARALNSPRIAGAFLSVGTVIAVPSYVALPLALFL